MSEAAPVVIVGAGPTGVVAATLLAQFDVPSLVLDRWDEVYRQPRAVHMDDECCRVIAQLGVAEEFARISRTGRGLRLLDRELGVLAEFRRDGDDSPHGFPRANMFDQPELEALLRANLAKHPEVTLRGGANVTNVEQIGPSTVRVSYTDRANGEEHIVQTPYVLGCDGANSVVRACAGVGMTDLRGPQGRWGGQRWLVVDIQSKVELDQWDGVHQVCDPDRAGTYMRIGPSRYRWEFQLCDGESAADFQELPALRELIAPWTSGASDKELELVRVAEYTFRAQVAERWRVGRVFLLGDAAHLTPPFIGQGLGAGLRDAMNLAWKLAAARDGALPEAALDSYEQERKPHAKAMIRLALGIGWAMTSGGRFGDGVRHALIPRLRYVPGLSGKITDSTTPALRGSAFVLRSRGAKLAGTLCPNPRLADGRRLDDVVGNRFALIGFGPMPELLRAAARERGAALVDAGQSEALRRWLGHGGALVRPDRTVMCAGTDLAALCAAIPAKP